MRASAGGWVGRRRGANYLLLFIAALALFLPRPSVTPDSDGLILVLDSLRSLLGVTGVVLCVTITGSVIMQRLHRPSVSSLLELAAAFLIGSAVTGSVLMAFGLLGYFSPLSVRVTCIALAFALFDRSTFAYMSGLSRGAIDEVRTLARPWGGRAVLATHGVLAIFLLLVALGPMISRDAASYHIEAPQEFLQAGSIYHLPDDQHLAFVSTFQILNGVLLASAGEASVAVLHWVALVLLVALVGVSGARLGSPRVGWLAMALLWSAPLLFRLGSDALTDVYLILSVLVVSLWVMTVDEAPISRGIIGLSLVAGATFLAKYQAGPYLIGAGLALLIFKGAAIRELDSRAFRAALALPWLLMFPLLAKNFLFFGAPLYPFGGARLYPRWLSESFDMPPDLAISGSYRVTASGRSVFTVWRWLLDPETLSNSSHGRFSGYPLICLAVPFGLSRENWRNMACLVLPAVTGALGLYFMSPLTNPRYLLSVIPAAVILSSLAFDRSFGAVFTGQRRVVAFGLVALLAAAPTFILLREDLGRDRRYAVAVGAYSWSEWAKVSYQHNRTSPLRLARLNEFLEDTVATNETVLLLFDRAASMYAVQTIQDNLYSNWPMLDDLLRGECLESSVASFVVWSHHYVEYMAGQGTDMKLVREGSFKRFADDCLTNIATLEGFSVYQVKQSHPSLAEISKNHGPANSDRRAQPEVRRP